MSLRTSALSAASAVDLRRAGAATVAPAVWRLIFQRRESERRGTLPSMKGPATITPTCPRCGYDQSGVAAAWRGSCPVEGRCSECGTGFAWADLFDRRRQTSWWYVEHAEGVRSAVARTGPTLARVLPPWAFWRRITVQVDTRPGVLAWWLLGWVIAFHLLTAPFVGLFLAGASRVGDSTVRALWELTRTTGWRHLRADAVNGLCWPFYTDPETGFWSVNAEASAAAPYLGALWVGTAWMLLLTVLPTTRRLAKLRLAHQWRAWCLSAAVILPVAGVVRVLAAAYEHFWIEALAWAATALTWAAMVWAVAWWGCAIRIGWGIRSWALLVLGFVVVFLSMPFAFGIAIVLLEMVFG